MRATAVDKRVIIIRHHVRAAPCSSEEAFTSDRSRFLQRSCEVVKGGNAIFASKKT